MCHKSAKMCQKTVKLPKCISNVSKPHFKNVSKKCQKIIKL